MESFENTTNDQERGWPIAELAKLSQKYNVIVDAERNVADTYVVQFNVEAGVGVNVRMKFNDPTAPESDLVITNMTVPESEMGKGYGSKVVQNILDWARENNWHEVRATQVEHGSHNESFWLQNGFTKDETYNDTNDFVYSV